MKHWPESLAKSDGGGGLISDYVLIVASHFFSIIMMVAFLFSGFPGCLLLLSPTLVVAVGLLVGWAVDKIMNWRHKWV